MIEKEVLDHFSPVKEESNTETHLCQQSLGAVLNHIVDGIPSLVKASCPLSPTNSVKIQVKVYCDEPVMLIPLNGGYRGRPVTLHWPT